MKKLLVVLLILVLGTLCVACGEEKNDYDKLKECISYNEISRYQGSNDVFRIEIVTIDGEKSPRVDGVVGEKKQRSEIKLVPIDVKGNISEYKVRLKDKEKNVELELHKDVLGMSYSAEVSNDIYNFNALEVDIIAEDEEVTLQLVNVLEEQSITGDKALSIAYDNIKDKITDYFDANNYKGEVIIKLIHSTKMSNSPYYYYVMFVNNSDKYASCLIEPKDGKIVNYKLK